MPVCPKHGVIGKEVVLHMTPRSKANESLSSYQVYKYNLPLIACVSLLSFISIQEKNEPKPQLLSPTLNNSYQRQKNSMPKTNGIKDSRNFFQNKIAMEVRNKNNKPSKWPEVQAPYTVRNHANHADSVINQLNSLKNVEAQCWYE